MIKKKSRFLGRSAKEDLDNATQDPEFLKAFRDAKAKLALREMLKSVAEKEGVGIRELARRMGTSPAQVTRLFTSPSESWRLDTLIKFGAALGKRLEISFR